MGDGWSVRALLLAACCGLTGILVSATTIPSTTLLPSPSTMFSSPLSHTPILTSEETSSSTPTATSSTPTATSSTPTATSFLTTATEDHYTHSTISFDQTSKPTNETENNDTTVEENTEETAKENIELVAEVNGEMYIVSWNEVPCADNYDVEVSCKRNHDCCEECKNANATTENTTFSFKTEPGSSYTVRVTTNGCNSTLSGESLKLKNVAEISCESVSVTPSTHSLQVSWENPCSTGGFVDHVILHTPRYPWRDEFFHRESHRFSFFMGRGDDWKYLNPPGKLKKLDDTCANNFTVEELDPFDYYDVIVDFEGNNNCTKSVQTKPDEPSEPREFQFQQTPTFNDETNQSRIAVITWRTPEHRNGYLKKYTLTYQLNNESSVNDTIPARECRSYCQRKLQLKPESSYRFTVTAENEEPAGKSSPPNTISLDTPAGIPFFTTSNPLDVVKDEVTYNSIILTINGTSISNKNGKVRKCEVWMYEECVESKDPDQFWSLVYCTTSPKSRIFPIVIGGEKPTESDCLQIDSPTLRENTCYSFYAEIRTIPDNSKISNIVSIKTNEAPSIIWIWILLGIAIIGLIGVLGIYIIYRRHYMPVLYLNFCRRRSESIELPMIQSPPDASVERQILLTGLRATVERLFSRGATSLSNEFANIKRLNPSKPCLNATLQLNKSKTRYFNILPYDETRVVLKEYPSAPGSDFINASYIHGYSVPREFIACQGPLRNTVNDFWRMVWEKNVHVIVMVTQCIERGKEKCCKYWPDVCKSFSFDGSTLKVKNTQEQEFYQDGYVLRNLQVSKRHKVRSIHQFHFVSWPDMGCPTTPDQLINFVKTVKNLVPQKSSHVLVHCSAGVGRTGTFIALSNLMEEMSGQNSIDVFYTVYRMRLHRTNMVQTEAQYAFLYKCVLKYYLDLKGQSESWLAIERRLDTREDIPDVINGTLAPLPNRIPVEPLDGYISDEEESLHEVDENIESNT